MGPAMRDSSKRAFLSELRVDLEESSNENVDRAGESWSPAASGTNKVAPAGLGNALAELVEVEDGRDMVAFELELVAACGILQY